MATTYELISSSVLTGSQADVTFSAIGSTYTDLCLKLSLRSTDNSIYWDGYELVFNGDTAANYSSRYIYNNAGTASSLSYSGANAAIVGLWQANAAPATSSAFSSAEVYIPSYTVSQKKQFSTIGSVETNTGSIRTNAVVAGLWQGTAAITSIVVRPSSGTSWAAGSSFYLYGIKNS